MIAQPCIWRGKLPAMRFVTIISALLVVLASTMLFAQANSINPPKTVKPVIPQQQPVIDSLKAILTVTQSSDRVVERIRTLRALSWEYRKAELRLSLDYGLQAVDAARTAGGESDARYQLAECLNVLGITYRNISNHTEAVRCFFEALKYAQQFDAKIEQGYALNNLGDVYRMERDYMRSGEYLLQALRLFEVQGDKQAIAYSYVRLGEHYEAQQQYSQAAQYFMRAFNIRQQMKDSAQLYVTLIKLGVLSQRERRFDEALGYYNNALHLAEKVQARIGIPTIYAKIASTYLDKQEYPKALEEAHHALLLSQSNHDSRDIQESSELLWRTYQALGDYRKAFQYQSLSVATRDSINNEENVRQIANVQLKYETDAQKAELALVKKNEQMIRYGLIASLVVAVVMIVLVTNRYRLKQRVNNEIKRQAAEIENANVALQLAHEQSERLLLNVLPAPIAIRLLGGEQLIAEHFDDVTVLFADIVGFTAFSTHIPPQEVVSLLNTVFSEFDALIETHKLEKIKTIGDGYMAVGGVPEPLEHSAEAMGTAALGMLAALELFNAMHKTTLQLRIGIHTGAVVAGIIGKNKFAYDLWGDTVNIASRMESHSEPGKIHCTREVYDKLRTTFEFAERGGVEIKSKGIMTTYFLLRRRIDSTQNFSS